MSKNLKLFLIITAIVCCLSLNQKTQAQSIVFEKTYRTETSDTVIMALTGAQTSDGGYLLGGYAAYGMYQAQMMFFKIDSVGNYQWKKMYGSLPTGSNIIFDMEPVGDGTFICCGEGTFSTEGEPGDLKPNNTMIMRVDEDANILWYKEFDTGYMEDLNEVAISDTGYICVGGMTPFGNAFSDLFWAVGDFDGNYCQTHFLNYIDSTLEYLQSVTKLPDGNFVMGGVADNRSMLIKVNQSGDTLKTKIQGNGYPGQLTLHDVTSSMQNIVYCGIFNDDIPVNSFFSYYAYLDFNLEILNEFFFEQIIFKSSFGKKIVWSEADNFVIAGRQETEERSTELWIKKNNSASEIYWEHFIGGTKLEDVWDIIKTSDRGYLIIGETESFSEFLSIYLIKTDSLGEGNYTSPVRQSISDFDNILLYPNPANENLCIENSFNNIEIDITIYGLFGNQIFQLTTRDKQTCIDVERWPQGLYIIKAEWEDGTYQGKIVINH
jgi:hypothetical protein